MHAFINAMEQNWEFLFTLENVESQNIIKNNCESIKLQDSILMFMKYSCVLIFLSITFCLPATTQYNVFDALTVLTSQFHFNLYLPLCVIYWHFYIYCLVTFYNPENNSSLILIDGDCSTHKFWLLGSYYSCLLLSG
jgi:hypothetical protein